MKLTPENKAKIEAYFNSMSPDELYRKLTKEYGFPEIDAPSKATTKEPSTDAAHLKKENR